MIAELINPSDAVTFNVDDPVVAGVAILVLGRGSYPLQAPDGGDILPLLMFGGADEWLKSKGITCLSAYLKENGPRMADFLETAMCCNFGTRKSLEAAFADLPKEERTKRIAKFNDAKRSSENDICGKAFKLAEQLRRAAKGQKVEKLASSQPIVLVG